MILSLVHVTHPNCSRNQVLSKLQVCTSAHKHDMHTEEPLLIPQINPRIENVVKIQVCIEERGGMAHVCIDPNPKGLSASES